MLLRLIPLALLAHCVCVVVGATQIGPETGSFFFREYSPKIYRATPQNWAVIEDPRGVIFVGNNDGVLEYDGQNWRKLKLPNSATVRSLAVDAKGTVYVGGQAEFGYLKADESGTLKYVSLLDKVDPQDRAFRDVWTTHATKSGVVFSSNERLFRWSPGGRVKAWKAPGGLSSAFVVDDVPYLQLKGVGLYRIVKDSFEPVPGGEQLAGASLRGVFRFRGATLVATTQGLYLQNGSTFGEFETEAKEFLNRNRIVRCLVLDDDTLAIATVQGGAVLLDGHGKILRVLDGQADGLHGSSVNGMHRDHKGGLWLALNNGLTRIDISANISRFAGREGLEEIVPSIERQDGTLYVGTMAGLSVLTNGHKGTPRFQPVPGIYGQGLTLVSTRHGLLVGDPTGFFEVSPAGVHALAPQEAIQKATVSAFDPETVYAVGRKGLFVLHWTDGRWQQVRHIDSGGDQLLSVAEEQAGLVWATSGTEVWRFDLRSDHVKMERFSDQAGLPQGLKYASRVRGSVLLATELGLFRADAKNNRFVPDTTFGAEFANGSRPVTSIVETADRSIWISGPDYHCMLQPSASGTYAIAENVLGNAGIRELYGVYVDTDHTVWASGIDGGVVRFEPASLRHSRGEFRALLREVQTVGRDRTVFGGAQRLAKAPSLEHEQNGLSFRFAAPLYDGVSEVRFRTFLEGQDRGWSAWTTQAEREYANLWEGRYVFHVQARDSKGQLSREALFPFRVLAPWFRQWWAYLLYIAIAVSAIWLFLQWRLLALASQNRKLEGIIEERTEEVRRQRDEIQAQRDEIKAEERRSQELLLNILPEAVAHELRATGSVKPITCDNITVCFTDFVGFTAASETMSAEELVQALGRYFSAFDRIVERYGLEKVKTIGDSYMFVSGLTQPKKTHAIDAVMAALDIVEEVARLAEIPPAWDIRVGLHSGPAVAGVVGCSKFAFDVWGKTVNFASRHESSGQINCVNISAQTYELIREYFECEARGPVRIKEGRYLDMYLVRGVKNESCDLTASANAG